MTHEAKASAHDKQINQNRHPLFTVIGSGTAFNEWLLAPHYSSIDKKNVLSQVTTNSVRSISLTCLWSYLIKTTDPPCRRRPRLVKSV